jgi:hypothetical protein
MPLSVIAVRRGIETVTDFLISSAVDFKVDEKGTELHCLSRPAHRSAMVGIRCLSG